MADVRLIKLTWENDEEFKMETQLNGGNWLTVLEMDENGHIHTLWDSAQKLCSTYFHTTLEEIGKVMKT